MSDSGEIYLATNTHNNKVYVGKTTESMNHRRNEHIRDALERNSPLLFHKAIRKHGASAFKWSIIEECSNDCLSEREKHFIKLFKSSIQFSRNYGYNIGTGGEGGNSTGRIVSKETRERIRRGVLKAMENPSMRAKIIGGANKGKKLKPRRKEHALAISNAHKGKKLTPEWKKAISDSVKRYWATKS